MGVVLEEGLFEDDEELAFVLGLFEFGDQGDQGFEVVGAFDDALGVQVVDKAEVVLL